MMWVIFALISPLIWSIVTLIDKIMIEKVMKKPISYYIISLAFQTSLIFLTFLIIQPTFTLEIFILSIISGAFASGNFLFYLLALQKEDASKVTPLSYLSNVFIVILAYIFLNEVFSFSKYFGIALLISGAVMLSYKKIEGKKLHFTPALMYIVTGSILYSCATVLNKYILNFIDPWTLMIGTMTGGYMLAFSLLFKNSIRKDFIETFRRVKKYSIVVFGTQILGLAGLISLYIALSLGPATLVSAITTIRPLIVLVLTVFFTMFVPHILEEEISKKNLGIKILSIALIIIGAIITIL